MTTSPNIHQILDYATGLPGFDSVPQSDGSVELHLDDQLVGHVYETGLVDLTFSRPVRDQLLTEGRADRHHVDPNSGWISAWVRTPEDVRDVEWLLDLAHLFHLQSLGDDEVTTVAPDVDLSTELDQLDVSTVLRVLVTTPQLPTSETPETAGTAQSA